jgi:hypothetical protein
MRARTNTDQRNVMAAQTNVMAAGDRHLPAARHRKSLHVAILAGSLAFALSPLGPFVPHALAQTDSITVTGSAAPRSQTDFLTGTGSRPPGWERVAGNDSSGTIPNSSYSGTQPAPAAAIPDHPAVDTPTPTTTPSPAIKQPPMPLGTNGMKPNASDMPLQ